MSLKTEAPNTDALSGGFAEPVFHAQSVFKRMMDAMARPGTIQTVAPDAEPPAPLGIAAGAIALTLCDHDTPVWLSSGLAKSAVPQWLGFHTGAPVTNEKAESRFAFVENAAALSSFGLFSQGTQEYPDRSTTLVIELPDLENGRRLALMGPGINQRHRYRPDWPARKLPASVDRKPRPLPARRRSRADLGQPLPLPAAHHQDHRNGDVTPCMLPSRVARPPYPMPIACSPTAAAATARFPPSASTRSSSSWRSASTASWPKPRFTTARWRRSPCASRAAT
jgi:alpha-D-ribose 1-methylphosphonate 5-triphosphate synthase subunit PhnH